MPQPRSQDAAEFRRRLAELVRAGRSPDHPGTTLRLGNEVRWYSLAQPNYRGALTVTAPGAGAGAFLSRSAWATQLGMVYAAGSNSRIRSPLTSTAGLENFRSARAA